MTKQINLQQIYEKRFSGFENYRNKVWNILVSQFFDRWIHPEFSILDLGCGYGEFINHTTCKNRHAMDLNPNARKKLNENIIFR